MGKAVVATVLLLLPATAQAYVVPVAVINPEQANYYWSNNTVYDPIENFWKWYHYANDVLARLESLTWADLDEFILMVNIAMSYESSVAYPRHGAMDYFSETFNYHLHLGPTHGPPGLTWAELRPLLEERVRNTYAGAFRTTVQQASEYEATAAQLKEIEASLNTALGRNSLLQADGAAQSLVAEELLKLRQQLLVLINTEITDDVMRDMITTVSENTLNDLITTEGWDLPHDYSKWPDWRQAMDAGR